MWVDDLEELMRTGGNITDCIVENINENKINDKNKNGITALTLAAEKNYAGLVVELLYFGAKITNIPEIAMLKDILSYKISESFRIDFDYNELMVNILESGIWDEELVKKLYYDYIKHFSSEEALFNKLGGSNGIEVLIGSIRLINILSEEGENFSSCLPIIKKMIKSADKILREINEDNDKDYYEKIMDLIDVLDAFVRKNDNMEKLVKWNKIFERDLELEKLEVIEKIMDKLSKGELDKRNKNGHTILMLSVMDEDVLLTKKLIEKEVDVNIKDKNGFTALTLAAEDEKIEILKLLLEAEKLTEKVDMFDKWKILNIAIKKENIKIVEILLNYIDSSIYHLEDKEGRTIVMIAAIKGDVDLLKLLIDGKESDEVNLNAVNKKDGKMALIYAIELGHFDIVKFLMDSGIDINIQDWSGKTALMHAVKNEYNEIVQWLISEGANPNIISIYGETPLILAAENENIDIMNTLFNQKILDIDMKNQSGKTALICAVIKNKEKSVKELINKGADIYIRDDKNYTPIMYAVENNNFNIVDQLMKAENNLSMIKNGQARGFVGNEMSKYVQWFNEDLNKQDISKRGNNEYSYSLEALMLAIKNRNKNMVKFLAKQGVDINKQLEAGITPLMYEVVNGNVDTVQILLDNQAIIDIVDDNGRNALMYAASLGKVKMVKLLLKYVKKRKSQKLNIMLSSILNFSSNINKDQEFNIDEQDKFGKTALICAAINRHFEVVEELIKEGANINKIYNDKTVLEHVMDISMDVLNDKEILVNEKTNELKKELKVLNVLLKKKVIIRDNKLLINDINMIVDYLLNSNKNKEIKAIIEESYELLLIKLVNDESLDIELIDQIIDRVSNVNAKDDNKKTVLMYVLERLKSESEDEVKDILKIIQKLLTNSYIEGLDTVVEALKDMLIYNEVCMKVDVLKNISKVLDGVLHNYENRPRTILGLFLKKINGDEKELKTEIDEVYKELIINLVKNEIVDKELIDMIIKNEQDLNYSDDRGRTLLTIASQLDDKEVINLLLDKGAKYKLKIETEKELEEEPQIITGKLEILAKEIPKEIKKEILIENPPKIAEKDETKEISKELLNKATDNISKLAQYIKNKQEQNGKY